MTIATQDVRFDDIHGQLVRAERASGGGILILPTIFGLNPVIREIAAALAGQGHTAFIWDHYCGVAPKAEHHEAVQQSRALQDGACLAQMRKCVDYMTSELRLAKVAALGYCLGGRYICLLGAREKRLAACAAVYPSIEVPNHPNQTEDAVALAAEIACPVLLAYPGRDQVTSRDTFLALQRSLQSRSQPSVVLLQPEADHGFMWRPGDHNKRAAAAAQPQIDTFFRTHLAG